jgi:hypothetical protein
MMVVLGFVAVVVLEEETSEGERAVVVDVVVVVGKSVVAGTRTTKMAIV